MENDYEEDDNEDFDNEDFDYYNFEDEKDAAFDGDQIEENQNLLGERKAADFNEYDL
jgi:hypothetical protein